MLGIATSNNKEDPAVRQSAMRLLNILADTAETGPLLFEAVVFQLDDYAIHCRGLGQAS